MAWPLLLGLAGAWRGCSGPSASTSLNSIKMRFSPLHGLVLGVLAIGAGLVAGYAYWDNQDVWTVGDNGWSTLVAGFTHRSPARWPA